MRVACYNLDMKQTYYLNGESLPTIPTPHDCEISRFEYNEKFITMVLDDIDLFDSTAETAKKTGAKCLKIKYHLLPPAYKDDPQFLAYLEKIRHKKDWYKEITHKKLRKQMQAKKNRYPDYLYHYVAFNSIIVNLITAEWNFLTLRIDADYVELEWI